jgi:hypothetical protein
MSDIEYCVQRHNSDLSLLKVVFADERVAYTDPARVSDNNPGAESSSKKSKSNKKIGNTFKMLNAKKTGTKTYQFSVTIKSKMDSFGLLRYFISLMLLFFLTMGSEMFTIFTAIKDATILHNFIKVYATTIDAWDFPYVATHAIDSAILWGRDSIIQGSPAHETARRYVNIFKEETIKSYYDLKSAELGTYSMNFTTSMFGTLDLCKHLFRTYPYFFQQCGMGTGSMIQGNLYNVLVKLHSTLDDFVSKLTAVIDNPKARYELLKTSTFKAYRAFSVTTTNAYSEIYYLIMLPLSEQLELLINKDKSLSSNYNFDKDVYLKLYCSICLFMLLLIYAFVIKPLINAFTTAQSILQLFPVHLLMTNRILVQRIVKRMPRSQ